MSAFDPLADIGSLCSTQCLTPIKVLGLTRYDAVVLSLGAEMRRREFLGFLGGAAAMAGGGARAAAGKCGVIGVLRVTSAADADEPRHRIPAGPSKGLVLSRARTSPSSTALGGRATGLPGLVADLIRRRRT